MEASILTGTKKVLNLDQSYTAFDFDILTFINSAFATLNQLGIAPVGFSVTDESAVWEDLGESAEMTNMIRTYVYLKVRSLFDPPGTGFLIEAMNNQISEQEWRLSNFREIAKIEAEEAT